MSRFKRFVHSLASGYVLLGANMLYTLASVPLALKYLSNAEYGLWTLATKTGVFIALVDFGLSASVARILIDHKDDRRSGSYGGMVKTGFLLGAVQGALVLLCGALLACFIGPLLHVDESLQPTLKWLLIGQCVVLAVSFATRTLGHLLVAHQRYDITNYAQALLFGVAFGITWFGFAHGQGVFSILWAYAFTVSVLIAVSWAGCLRLKLWPQPGEWGRLTREQFKDVFAFGSDIFVFALGAQLITASQTVLLTRFIGLEAVAVWGVFTRVFEVLQQIIYRIFDYSSSALAEMIVRGEKRLLAVRFRQIVILSASLSVAAGTVFALCNHAFVKLWTSSRFDKPILYAADIKEPRLLAGRLQAQGDAPAQFLWQQFSPATRERIAKLAAHKETADQLQTNLTSEINRLLISGLFSNQTSFAGVTRSQETRQLPPGPADKLESEWFNRHLLEDAFPREIADSRKAHWSRWNDFLLALWLVICASLHAHTGLVGQTKSLRFVRYIFFLEGLAFVALTACFHRFGGITSMLCVSVACSLAFSFGYGLWRTRQYFNLTGSELAEWHCAPLRLVMWLVPVATVVNWLTHSLPPALQLALNGGLVGVWAVVTLLRFGLDAALQQELVRRTPAWAKRMLVRIGLPPPNADSR
jgi:O-antigen/teichoic acid export membrane protein